MIRLCTLATIVTMALAPALAGAQPDTTTTTTTTTTNTTNTTVAAPVIAPVPVLPAEERDLVYDDWNAPVFTSGAIAFGGSYLASVIVAASSSHPGAERLYVPVLGPWLALGDWGNCPITSPACDRNTTDKVLLVGDAVFQLVGVLGMVDGLVRPTHHTRVVRTVDIHPTANGFALGGAF